VRLSLERQADKLLDVAVGMPLLRHSRVVHCCDEGRMFMGKEGML